MILAICFFFVRLVIAQQCPPGSFKSGQFCEPCPSNQVKPEFEDSWPCRSCPSGFAPDDDRINCIPCTSEACSWRYYPTVLAGAVSTDDTSFLDGQLFEAKFAGPHGIAVENETSIFVSEWTGRRIRKISTTNGKVTTISITPYNYNIFDVLFMENDKLVFSVSGVDEIVEKNLQTGYQQSQSADSDPLMEFGPHGLINDAMGNIFFVGNAKCQVKMWNRTSNEVITVAGNPSSNCATSLDGSATFATFNRPRSIAIDSINGELYVTDSSKSLRRITDIYSSRNVETIYGNIYNIATNEGIVYDNARKFLFSSDRSGKKILRFTKHRVPIPIAEISNPVGIDTDIKGNIYVASVATNQIMKVYACPPNSIFNGTCQCLPGHEFQEPNWCLKCAAGYYKSLIGNIKCILCQVGTSDGISCANRTSSSMKYSSSTSITITSLTSLLEPDQSPSPSSLEPEQSPSHSLLEADQTAIPLTETFSSSNTQVAATLATASIMRKGSSGSDIQKIAITASTVFAIGENSFTDSLLILAYTGYAVFVIFLLLVTARVFINYYNRKLAKSQYQSSYVTYSTDSSYTKMSPFSHISTTISSSTDILTSHTASSSIRTDSTLTNGTTAFLSIPGFLQLTQSDFQCISQLGEGGNSIVHLGKLQSPNLSHNGKKIVIKEFTNINDKNNDGKKQLNIDAFYQELSIMYMLRQHRNTAKLLGYTERPFMILLKYYSHGDLRSFLLQPRKKNQEISLKLRLRFIKNISKALEYMAKNGIAHRDVKPLNVLVDEEKGNHELYAVLTDFGLACTVNQANLSVKAFRAVQINGASLKYASPETIIKFYKSLGYFDEVDNKLLRYDPLRSDIFSLAVSMHEILELTATTT